MSISVRDQIRSHYKAVDTSQETIEWAEIVARLDTEPSFVAAPRRRMKVGFWVAVAAAVVTILLIGVVPLLTSNQATQQAGTIVPTTLLESTPTTLVESTPTTLVESTPTTLGELVLIPGTWSRVPHDKAVFGEEGNQSMSSVIAGGPGLLAVGGDGLHQSGAAAVWTSVDGITWSRVAHDEAVFGGAGEQWMGTVTTGGPGLVAVGWELVSGFNANAAVWTSSDGVSWSRVPHDEDIFGGQSYQAMSGVTAGGPGLVAIGEDRSRDFEDGDVAVWTSADGFTWSRVAHDEAVFGTGGVTSVTRADSGLIVAVGSEGPDDSNHAAVWTSVDGFTWSRVPHDEAVFGGEGQQGMSSVTVGGPGLVAVGMAGSADHPHAAVWTSPDGFTWSRVPDDESVFRGAGPREAGGQAMENVAANGQSLVAVGYDGEGAAVWTSQDGISWSRVPNENGLAAGWVSSVTFGGPGLVAVGNDGADGGSDAAVWVMP
jgi:hypothetical protein